MKNDALKKLFSGVMLIAYALFMALYTPVSQTANSLAQAHNALPTTDTTLVFLHSWGLVAVLIVLFVIWLPNILKGTK